MNGPKIVLRHSDPFPFAFEDSADQQEETMQYIIRWMAADASVLGTQGASTL